MSSPLFRPEALAAHNPLRWGRPIALMPISWAVVSALLAALVAATVVFLTTATYARKETVRGILKPVGGETRVLATQGGALRELYVAEGAHVARGAPLARISRETLLSDGAIADDQVLDGLRQEEATLRDRLSALEGSAPLDAASMAASLAALEADRGAALAVWTPRSANSAPAAPDCRSTRHSSARRLKRRSPRWSSAAPRSRHRGATSSARPFPAASALCRPPSASRSTHTAR